MAPKVSIRHQADGTFSVVLTDSLGITHPAFIARPGDHIRVPDRDGSPFVIDFPADVASPDDADTPVLVG